MTGFKKCQQCGMGFFGGYFPGNICRLCFEKSQREKEQPLQDEKEPVDVEKELEIVTGALSRLFGVSLEDAAKIVEEGYRRGAEDGEDQ